jgi:hypothetical protein
MGIWLAKTGLAGIGWIGIGLALAQEAVPRLQPYEDHRVLIFHDGYEAEWQLRFPEVVAAREGTFLSSPRTRMIWQTYADGSRGYDWQTNEQYAAAAYQQIGKRVPMIVGMEVSPRMRVSADRIDLTLKLKNISAQTFHDVTADGGCLQHHTERFFDNDHRRTYMLADSGVIPLDQADRSLAIRSKYFFNPAWYEERATRAYEDFWGRSQTRPKAPWIVSKAATGPGAIGIAWEQCFALRQSSDAGHRCMHSSPYFGDLKPGESMTRLGVIVFGDTIDEVIGRLQKERLSIYSKSPRDMEK